MLSPTIMIIDDDKPIRNLLEIVLQRAGYMTLIASDGLEGMSMILEHHPSLIITDDDMPLMRGRDLCCNLKNDPDLRAIPVVIHSTHIKSQFVKREEYACADALLPKPSIPREIIDTVRSLVGVSVD